jgi:hypothetical protein
MMQQQAGQNASLRIWQPSNLQKSRQIAPLATNAYQPSPLSHINLRGSSPNPRPKTQQQHTSTMLSAHHHRTQQNTKQNQKKEHQNNICNCPVSSSINCAT